MFVEYYIDSGYLLIYRTDLEFTSKFKQCTADIFIQLALGCTPKTQ